MTPMTSSPAEVARGALEQRGLARAGRAHQVEREDAAGAQPVPVLPGQARRSGQHPLFQRDGPAVGVLVPVVVPVRVVVVAVLVPGAVVVLVPGPGLVVGAAAGRAHLTPPAPSDLEFLAGEHGDVGAPARAQHDRRLGLELGAAGAAPAPRGPAR